MHLPLKGFRFGDGVYIPVLRDAGRHRPQSVSGITEVEHSRLQFENIVGISRLNFRKHEALAACYERDKYGSRHFG